MISHREKLAYPRRHSATPTVRIFCGSLRGPMTCSAASAQVPAGPIVQRLTIKSRERHAKPR